MQGNLFSEAFIEVAFTNSFLNLNEKNLMSSVSIINSFLFLFQKAFSTNNITPFQIIITIETFIR